MPKKLHTNPKAEEARARKQTVKKEKQAAELKAAVDSLWSDEGQSASEKRAQEREAKRIEEQHKKEQKRLAQLKDEQEMKAVKTVKVNPHKVTLATIQQQQQKEQKERELSAEKKLAADKNIIIPDEELPININQAQREQEQLDRERYGEGGVVSARSLTEAVESLSTLSLTPSTSIPPAPDRHPEKRMKAAYKDYEEKQWPIVKAENPSLKFSQIKELIFKQWQKSPENPINQTKLQQQLSAATGKNDNKEETEEEDD